jgi:hypothetical protein
MACNDSVRTTAGTIIYIGLAPALISKASFLDVLLFDIGEVTSIGELGESYNTATRTTLASRNVIEKKTTANHVSPPLNLAISDANAGQQMAKTALHSDDCYTICIERQNGVKKFFVAQISSFTVSYDTDEFENGSIQLLKQSISLDVEPDDIIIPDPVLTGINISGSATVTAGSVYSYTATPLPTDAPLVSVSWSISDSTKGTINQSGQFTPATGQTGAVNIIAQSGVITGTYAVNIIAQTIELQSISVTGSGSIEYEGSATYTANPYPFQASTDGLVWSVSDDSKASINSAGVLTAKAGQSGDIYVFAQVGSISGQLLVSIQDEVIVIPDLTGISVSGSQTVSFNGNSTYSAAAIPSAANFSNLVWSVSDSSKATINQQGVLSAIDSGSVNVIATDGAIVGQLSVTISEEAVVIPDLTGISISGVQDIDIGDVTTYTATPLPSAANFSNLVWSVSDTSKATINQQGTLTALDSGTFNVVATDGTISNLIAVTIAEEEPAADGAAEWATQAEWK